MPAEQKKNTGLVIGLICGALAVVAAIVTVVIIAVVNAKPSLIGTWKLTHAEENGQDFTEIITAFGEASITFKDDGTGVMTMYSNDEKFEYDKNNLEMTQNGSDEKTKIEVKDGKMTITIDTLKLEYEKKKD